MSTGSGVGQFQFYPHGICGSENALGNSLEFDFEEKSGSHEQAMLGNKLKRTKALPECTLLPECASHV